MMQSNKDNNYRYYQGPTHEEGVTQQMKHHIRSYRDLPKLVYQITKKFRNEKRPKNGQLRTREFLMKDAYSFDTDIDSMKITYKHVQNAYESIFTKQDLKWYCVEANSGAMGGNISHEYHLEIPSGEDIILCCDTCNYVSIPELCEFYPLIEYRGTVNKESIIHDPRTVDSNTDYCIPLEYKSKNVTKLSNIINQILYNIVPEDTCMDIPCICNILSGPNNIYYIVVFRADYGIKLEKIADSFGIDCKELKIQSSKEAALVLLKEYKRRLKHFTNDNNNTISIDKIFKPQKTNWKAVPLDELIRCEEENIDRVLYDKREDNDTIDKNEEVNTLRVLIDTTLINNDATTYDNINDIDDINEINKEEKIHITYNSTQSNFTIAQDGDECVQQICEKKGKLKKKKTIEIGHTFQQNTRYSNIFNLNYQYKDHQKKLVYMGCYGIGQSRQISACVEKQGGTDERGLIWPQLVSPYTVYITSVDSKIKSNNNTINELKKTFSYSRINFKKNINDISLTGITSKIANKHNKTNNIQTWGDTNNAQHALYIGAALQSYISYLQSDIIIDDRLNLSFGQRLRQAFQIGIPYQIIVGQEMQTSGRVELHDRKGSPMRLLTIDELINFFKGNEIIIDDNDDTDITINDKTNFKYTQDDNKVIEMLLGTPQDPINADFNEILKDDSDDVDSDNDNDNNNNIDTNTDTDKTPIKILETYRKSRPSFSPDEQEAYKYAGILQFDENNKEILNDKLIKNNIDIISGEYYNDTTQSWKFKSWEMVLNNCGNTQEEKIISYLQQYKLIGEYKYNKPCNITDSIIFQIRNPYILQDYINEKLNDQKIKEKRLYRLQELLQNNNIQLPQKLEDELHLSIASEIKRRRQSPSRASFLASFMSRR